MFLIRIRTPKTIKQRSQKAFEKILRKEDRELIFIETRKLAAIVHNIFTSKFNFDTDGLGATPRDVVFSPLPITLRTLKQMKLLN